MLQHISKFIFLLNIFYFTIRKKVMRKVLRKPFSVTQRGLSQDIKKSLRGLGLVNLLKY